MANWFQRAVGRVLRGRKTNTAISTSLDLFRKIFGGRESSSGKTVNTAVALEVATVLACCRVLANGVSQVPFRLYRDGGGGRELARDHPLFQVLYRRPNPWQTSYEFRETLMFHTALCFNAYVFVNRVGRSREIRELIPIEPGRVEVEQLDDMRLQYKVHPRPNRSGAAKVFPQEAIWHLRGPSWNSWMGLDLLYMARNAIGLSLALEDSHAKFHKNGAKTSGLYSVQEKLSPEKYQQLREWFEKEDAETGAYRALILDMGATYTPFTMTGVDAQHLETRKHQIEEICRCFGVMPIMVGHADKTATYASAEQMFQAHVIHALSPWYERIEQSADVNLLTPEERDAGFYTKFTPNALMRGVAKDRGEFYAKALGSGGGKGWMTQNEVRSLEELDRSEDPEADALPQSMLDDGEGPAPDEEETQEDQAA